MIYLASPYSAVDIDDQLKASEVRELRYQQTMAAQKALFQVGYPVFATIVHTHVTAKAYGLPTDAQFWMTYNNHMIDLSKAVFILQLPKWELSRGVTAEINYANSNNIPVYEIPVEFSSDCSEVNLEIPIVPELMTMARTKKALASSIITIPTVLATPLT